MTEASPAEQKEASEFLEGVMQLRREMSLKEVRMLKKCQEDANDTLGVLAGVLWLTHRRDNPSLTFDDVLSKYSEEKLIEAVKRILPNT